MRADVGAHTSHEDGQKQTLADTLSSLSLSLGLARFNLSYDDVRYDLHTYGFTRIFSSAIPNSTLHTVSGVVSAPNMVLMRHKLVLAAAR